MNGIPATLVNNPVGLNRAGNSGGGSNSNNQYTDALNAGELAAGNIGSPSPSVIQSAQNYTKDQNTDEHPILSANGSWVSSTTGQPWHGSYQNPNGSTQYYSNGQQVNDIGQVGLQTPQIGVQQIQKNPAISGQVSNAVSQNAQNTNLLNKSFAQYLQEAQQQGQEGAAQLAQSEAAINPAGTISRLNSDVTGAAQNTNATLNNYVTAQNQNQANIAAANQNYQNTQNAALTNLGTNLTTENANYGTAAQNVVNQAYANALKQANLYQLTSGTPSSGSGQMSNRYIAAYNAVNLPLQQDLANRAIATTNQLYGLGSNLQNQYLANLQGQYAGVGNLNQDIANRFTQGNQYLTGLDQQTAQYIQGLQQQVATLSPQLAMQYLQSLGIPIQTAQQIISGNTANLSQLANLDQSANFYNLYSPYSYGGPSYASPRYSLPGTPATSTATSGGFGNVAASLNQQQNSLAQAQQQWLQTPQGQQWLQANNTSTATNNYGVPGTDVNGNPVVNMPGAYVPGQYALPA